MVLWFRIRQMFKKSLCIIGFIAMVGAHAQGLHRDLNTVLMALPQGTQVSAAVYDVNQHRLLFKRNLHHRIASASTAKLFTATAAVMDLKPNFRFHTRMVLTGEIKQQTLLGDVWFIFQGDPSFSRAHLNRMLDTLHQRGIRRIHGHVYLVGQPLADQSYGPGWMWDELSQCYAAPLSVFTVDENCLTVHMMRPHRGHVRPRLSLSVPNGLPLSNRLMWRQHCPLQQHQKKLTALGLYGYRWTGCVAPSDGVEEVAVRSTRQWMMAVVRHALLLQDIHLQGSLTLKDRMPPLTQPVLWTQVQDSEPLFALLKPVLSESNNFYASRLLLQMGLRHWGVRNTWQRAARRVESILKAQGIVSPPVIDGSGLSRLNRVSASELLQLLRHIVSSPVLTRTMMPALSVLGHEGTLAQHHSVHLPEGVSVLGKTGSMQGVSAVAGFVSIDQDVRWIYILLLEGGLKQHQARISVMDAWFKVLGTHV
jgi:serine-type D-Ala-D-Ala carboxypeptidase/endopeptidase (penicillin-binding protein 4)